ncbi:DUF1453 domain-containing protein [Streptomyces avermitilis]|uniref:DUF1453 domain-containing protein n=1 Tax=Streptomyces avermitilis TaxID=33903 RepID=UPI00367E4555
MSGLTHALLIIAVVVLVVARQFRMQKISADRRWWIVPAVLAFLAVREPGLLDAHHRTGSGILLGAELLIGVATGVGWAWTTRIWTDADGTVWSKSTQASVGVWIVGIVLRVGLFGLGVLLGLRQESSALLLALAATLLLRSGVLIWRVHSLGPADGGSRAYGDGVAQPSWNVPRPSWKERV